MSTHMSSLEPRRLFSIDLPGLIDPGSLENFDGVRIDASRFPASPVTVQVTARGPVVPLPVLRDGVVTASGTASADSIRVENRVGVDPSSDLPGIVFFDGLESGTAGVQIFGNIASAVSSFDTINASLDAALASLIATRDSLAAANLPTAELDASIAELSGQVGSVKSALDRNLDTPFVRVTLRGVYDAYFLASEVGSVRVDAGQGNDTVVAPLISTAALRINGGAGNDSLSASGRATLIGGIGNDRLVAGDASWLEGNAGNDILIGSPGKDTLIGGAGDDSFFLPEGARAVPAEVMDMTPGRDRLIARLVDAFSKDRPLTF